MKLFFKFLLLNSIFLINTKGIAQSYISFNKTEILRISVYYTITNNVYQPDYNQNSITVMAYAAMQERFDRNFDFIKAELTKVRNLQLINKSNQDYLTEFKRVRMPFWRSISHADLSKGEIVSHCLKYIVDIYDYSSIRDEIKLLQSCNYELSRIKNQDPDNYIYSKRYRAISNVLLELETCNNYQIKNLSWEKIELGM